MHPAGDGAMSTSVPIGTSGASGRDAALSTERQVDHGRPALSRRHRCDSERDAARQPQRGILVGPVPALGEDSGACGVFWADWTLYSYSEAEAAQVAHAGIAMLVAGPATALWVWGRRSRRSTAASHGTEPLPTRLSSPPEACGLERVPARRTPGGSAA